MSNKIKIKINPPLPAKIQIYHEQKSVYITMCGRKMDPSFSELENALYAILFDLRSPANAILNNKTYEVLVKESGSSEYTSVKIEDENILQNFLRYNIRFE